MITRSTDGNSKDRAFPTPIFVLGKHRSGTTWLANSLIRHTKVAGVAHEAHHGIHESAYFSWVVGRYGDLADRSNFAQFVEVMSASDYFRLAGATRDWLNAQWPTTYEGVFRALMDRLAEREGAQYWVEKSPTHTLLAERLAALYPDARFVGIERPLIDQASSEVAMSEARTGLARSRDVVATALSWAHYKKVLRAFDASCDRCLLIRYEDLRSERDTTMRRVCSFLDVPFEDEMCASAYRPNTSFADKERADVLTAGETRLLQTVSLTYGLMPLSIGTAFRNRLRGRRQRPLPTWFFRMSGTPDADARGDAP